MKKEKKKKWDLVLKLLHFFYANCGCGWAKPARAPGWSTPGRATLTSLYGFWTSSSLFGSEIITLSGNGFFGPFLPRKETIKIYLIA